MSAEFSSDFRKVIADLQKILAFDGKPRYLVSKSTCDIRRPLDLEPDKYSAYFKHGVHIEIPRRLPDRDTFHVDFGKAVRAALGDTVHRAHYGEEPSYLVFQPIKVLRGYFVYDQLIDTMPLPKTITND